MGTCNNLHCQLPRINLNVYSTSFSEIFSIFSDPLYQLSVTLALHLNLGFKRNKKLKH